MIYYRTRIGIKTIAGRFSSSNSIHIFNWSHQFRSSWRSTWTIRSSFHYAIRTKYWD